MCKHPRSCSSVTTGGEEPGDVETAVPPVQEADGETDAGWADGGWANGDGSRPAARAASAATRSPARRARAIVPAPGPEGGGRGRGTHGGPTRRVTSLLGGP